MQPPLSSITTRYNKTVLFLWEQESAVLPFKL